VRLCRRELLARFPLETAARVGGVAVPGVEIFTTARANYGRFP